VFSRPLPQAAATEPLDTNKSGAISPALREERKRESAITVSRPETIATLWQARFT